MHLPFIIYKTPYLYELAHINSTQCQGKYTGDFVQDQF